MDFRPFFIKDSNIIKLHVITNPKSCVTTIRTIEKSNEKKVNFKSVIKDANNSNNYFCYEFNIRKMELVDDVSKTFFEFN